MGTAPSEGHLRSQTTGQTEVHWPLQVLLTGKPCRNFQVLVAYSMLQMVRQQVLQESMTGDDILLVRASSGKAQSSPTGSRRPLTQTQRPWLPLGNTGETDILQTLCQVLV